MNIIVTGASKGIGREVVKHLSRNPEHKIFAIARNRQLLETLKEDCEFPDQVFVFDFDLSQKTYSKEFYEAIRKTESIDVLINNAGTLINKPFMELTEDDWKSVFEVNLFSTVKLTQFLIPQLKKSKQAHIVNIGSMGGVENSAKFAGLSAYSASKAALANLTQCIAEELKENYIHCNCLALGAVNTAMLQQAFPGYQANTSPQEMAAYIADFATTQGKFMNGKIIHVSNSTP